MFETDTLPSEAAICSQRRGTHFHYHYLQYYGHGHPWLATGAGWVPSVDVYETDDEFTLEVNLAGIKPEQVHLEIRGNIVLLSGERPESDASTVRCYYLIEIERGQFARTVELPVSVDPATARAESHDGMLVVRVGKIKGGHAHGCSSADSLEGLE
jgi:HSP20 family protein